MTGPGSFIERPALLWPFQQGIAADIASPACAREIVDNLLITYKAHSKPRSSGLQKAG